MQGKRTDRLNSLIREVLTEVIQKQVKNPHVSPMVSVTCVEITPDLRYAKVYINVIGDKEEKQKTLDALQVSAGFIATNASKKMTIHYFPTLTFYLDQTLDDQMRIEGILYEVKKEKEQRDANNETSS